MKSIIFALAAMLAAPFAFAQSDASSGSQSAAIVAPGNIGNPVVNIAGAPPVTQARIDSHSNQAASVGTTFINPPSADVCARPGDALAVQVVGGGLSATKGGTVYDRCDMRADAISLKVTGQPPAVIKARYCMDAAMREAFAAAGEPCTDARPVAAAPAAQVATAGEPSDPFIRARMGLSAR